MNFITDRNNIKQFICVGIDSNIYIPIDTKLLSPQIFWFNVANMISVSPT